MHRLRARQIVRAIADAATRWHDADFPPRVRVLDGICARTGYSVPVVEYALDALFGSIGEAALVETIARELGTLDVLDRLTPRGDGMSAQALPVGTACIISSRTTIGVAIVPAVFALCAKNAVVVKDREDGLVRAFFDTLAQEHDAFAEAATARVWSGASQDLGEYDAIAAFGSDDTLREIRAQTSIHARFIGFGAKASAGYVTREALGDERTLRGVLEAAARSFVLYDTEGCLSPHVMFVERSAHCPPERVAELLAAATERAGVEFPPGKREASVDAALLQARSLAAFRAASGQGRLFSDERGSFLIVLDPPLDEPPLFLVRALAVYAVDSTADARRYLQHHGVTLEALAAPSARADVVELASALGASRVTPFHGMQRPMLGGNHGGRPRIVDFVRWITVEL